MWTPPEDERLDKSRPAAPPASAVPAATPGAAWTPPADEVVKRPATMADVPLNALKDAGGMAQAAAPSLDIIGRGPLAPIVAPAESALRLVGGTVADIARGKEPMDTEAGQVLKETGKGLKQELTDLPQAFKEHPVQVAMDIIGLVAPVAEGVGAAARLARPAADVAGTVARKGMTSVLGPSEEAIMARTNRPAAIQGAKMERALAQDVADEMEKIRQKVAAEAPAAKETLRTSASPKEGAISKKTLLSIVRGIKGQLTVGGTLAGDVAKTAAKAMDGLGKDIKAIGSKNKEWVRGKLISSSKNQNNFEALKAADFLPERTVKEFIQAMDDNINWQDPALKKKNQALKDFRRAVDAKLKDKNHAYRDKMAPLSDKMDLLSELEDMLTVEDVKGKYQPSAAGTTERTLKGIGADKRADPHGVLNRLKIESGRDFVREAQDARLASEFAGGKKKRFVGIFDVDGGRIADKLIDFYLKARPERLGKYADLLSKAQARGPAVFLAAKGLLAQRDPEFRAMIEGLGQGDGTGTQEKEKTDEQSRRRAKTADLQNRLLIQSGR